MEPFAEVNGNRFVDIGSGLRRRTPADRPVVTPSDPSESSGCDDTALVVGAEGSFGDSNLLRPGTKGVAVPVGKRLRPALPPGSLEKRFP